MDLSLGSFKMKYHYMEGFYCIFHSYNTGREGGNLIFLIVSNQKINIAPKAEKISLFKFHFNRCLCLWQYDMTQKPERDFEIFPDFHRKTATVFSS